ncbi:hypothetical protein OUZ56_027878 [Daphnia magna]|uniref:Uncharacterized protein n=1 Tax=Daphnia magna TaxID=35525 RepID=A0ABR0B274_9CRUS|nr:hypothetical protein OUZ56_027878 [Daphnia magna]
MRSLLPVMFLNQILSWLCRKGEETLSRYHVTLADSLAAAKSQQREFQRFLILAQRGGIRRKVEHYAYLTLELGSRAIIGRWEMCQPTFIVS